ncbi:MAG: hypothetical protein ABFS23_08140 [Pseudomonadota bacterium]
MSIAPPNSGHAHHTPGPVAVGAEDWLQAQWLRDYFPENLPEEWRLAYYANDFSAVLVPASSWSNAAPTAWAHWAEEVPPGFRLFLLLDETPVSEDARASAEACAAALGSTFGGHVSRRCAPENSGFPILCVRPIHSQGPPGDIVLVTAADLADRRTLGQRLQALAGRSEPPRAIIAEAGVPAAEVSELRTLAELTGLA